MINSKTLFTSSNVPFLLQLTDMKPSDLGEYQCYGYNEKGRDRETITVTAAPGPVRVLDAEPTGKGFTYRVSWEVNSLSPINYYYFAYREVSASFLFSFKSIWVIFCR